MWQQAEQKTGLIESLDGDPLYTCRLSHPPTLSIFSLSSLSGFPSKHAFITFILIASPVSASVPLPYLIGLAYHENPRSKLFGTAHFNDVGYM